GSCLVQGRAIAGPSERALDVIAQPANSSSAEVRWTLPSPAPAGWQLTVVDLSSGRRSKTSCWACNHNRLHRLTIGHKYKFLVAPITRRASRTGPAAFSHAITVGA